MASAQRLAEFAAAAADNIYARRCAAVRMCCCACEGGGRRGVHEGLLMMAEDGLEGYGGWPIRVARVLRLRQYSGFPQVGNGLLPHPLSTLRQAPAPPPTSGSLHHPHMVATALGRAHFFTFAVKEELMH